ncbi:50S ribosomal protein L24 [Candidatus Pacearchaeota archaeon]|nr:50S ribosomal protein L24 [Candidatus Pacearchaeota archaeon]
MKHKFSTKWKASIRPSKQRNYKANAPMHIRHKFLASNLSKELRKKYTKRSFPIKKGDKIKILRGEFRNKTGKVEAVDLKKLRVTVEGLNRLKKDGAKVPVYLNPSNLQITELNLEDQKRIQAIGRQQEKKFKQLPKSTEDKKEIKGDKKNAPKTK